MSSNRARGPNLSENSRFIWTKWKDAAQDSYRNIGPIHVYRFIGGVGVDHHQERTTVDGCWALALGDCGGKLSREHTVSECLFRNGTVTVKGLEWCSDEPKTIGVDNLTRKILCQTHNSRLSELDSEALKCFEAIRESARLNEQRARVRRKSWTLKHFEVDIRLLERWLLKITINLVYQDKWRFGDYGEAAGPPRKSLFRWLSGAAVSRSMLACTSRSVQVKRSQCATVSRFYR
jgi:hypothetical protein